MLVDAHRPYRYIQAMKKFTSTLLAVALMAMSADALEQRTFHSADNSKTFEATLTAYNAQKKNVTVTYATGKKLSFPLGLLSEDCQEYVMSKLDALTINSSVRLNFKEIKGEREGDAIPTHYEVGILNSGKRPIQEIELKYTIYYVEGSVTARGRADKTSAGTINTEELYQGITRTLSTEPINIIRTVKKAEGGG